QNALVGWRTPPAQCERHVALAFDEIEGGEMRSDRLGDLIRIDALLADIGRLQNLQIASRQKLAGLGDVAGITAELHAVFGGPERGCTDALAGREQRPWQRAGIDARTDCAAE